LGLFLVRADENPFFRSNERTRRDSPSPMLQRGCGQHAPFLPHGSGWPDSLLRTVPRPLAHSSGGRPTAANRRNTEQGHQCGGVAEVAATSDDSEGKHRRARSVGAHSADAEEAGRRGAAASQRHRPGSQGAAGRR
jgi:hypothetical protein